MEVNILDIAIAIDPNSGFLLKEDVERYWGKPLNNLNKNDIPNILCQIMEKSRELGTWEVEQSESNAWYDQTTISTYSLKSSKGHIAMATVNYTINI